MQSGEASEVEYEVVQPDGTKRWVFSKATPKGEMGTPDHLLGVVLDITDGSMRKPKRSISDAGWRT